MLLFPHLLLGSEITISINMPKEIVEIQLKRNAAKKEPWGLRIGGGVDRGKVLVLEKVFLYVSCSDKWCSIFHVTYCSVLLK